MEIDWRHIDFNPGPMQLMMALLLAFLSIYCLVIILERSWVHWITRRQRRVFAARFPPLLGAGQWAEIVRMAQSKEFSRVPVARSLQLGLEAWLARQSAVSDPALAWFVARDAMRRSAALSQAELKRGQRALIVSAIIALLTGLLSCVHDMYNALEGMSLVGEGGLAAISAGVAHALTMPAWGLLIALVAILGHAWLAMNTERMMSETHGVINDILNRLARPQPPSAP